MWSWTPGRGKRCSVLTCLYTAAAARWAHKVTSQMDRIPARTTLTREKKQLDSSVGYLSAQPGQKIKGWSMDPSQSRVFVCQHCLTKPNM